MAPLRRNNPSQSGSRWSSYVSPTLSFVCLSGCPLQLGVSTVALSVPIVLLKRQRAARALTKAPSPRRRAGPPPISRPSPTTAVPAAARPEPIRASEIHKAETLVDPGFNGALYSAKAFGIATTLVTVGAFVGIWAVQASLGVQTVRAMF